VCSSDLNQLLKGRFMLRLLSVLTFVLLGSAAFAAQMTEQEKIHSLLNSFDSPNVTFIRNGEEHDGAWAKAHLSEKMAMTKPEVKTADDFINKVASSSSETGKPYMVKMQNGQTMESGKWLQMKLTNMAQPSAGAAAPMKNDMGTAPEMAK